MSLAEVISVQQAEQAEAAYATYKRVLLKAAKGGKLTAADQNDFTSAVVLLGITGDEIEKTEHAIADHMATTPVAKENLEDSKSALAAALAALQEHQAETARTINERGRTESGLIGAVEAAEKSAARIVAARQRMKDIEGQHWRIFNAEDPVEAAKKFSIAFTPRTGQQPESDYQIYNFASLLAGPPIDLSNRKLVTLAGQTKADAQQMLEISQAKFTGALARPCFLLPSGMSEPTIAGHSTLFRPISQIIQLINEVPEPRFDPMEFVFLTWPEVSEAQLVEMVELIAKTFNSHPWSANSRKHDPRYYTPVREIKAEWLVWPTCLNRPTPQAAVETFPDEPQQAPRGPQVWTGERDGSLQPVG